MSAMAEDLTRAIEGYYLKELRSLLASRPRLSATACKWLFVSAASREWRAGVRALVAGGLDINSRDRQGWTALMTVRDSANALRILAENGADVNVRMSDGTSTLLWAVMFSRDQDKTAKVLLDAGADPCAADREGIQPLHYVGGDVTENMRDVKCARLLIAAGADVHARSRSNITPLMTACIERAANVVRYLLRRGADPHARDDRARNSLYFASWHATDVSTPAVLLDWEASQRRARKLLDQPLLSNVPEFRGRTALHLAAEAGNYKLIGLLLKSGADRSLRDKKRRTARDVALELGHARCARLLEPRNGRRAAVTGVST